MCSNFSVLSSSLCAFEKLGVVFCTESDLALIEHLFDESAVLDVQDTVGIAFEVGIVGDHDVGSLASEIDVEKQVHDLHRRRNVQVTGGLIEK